MNDGTIISQMEYRFIKFTSLGKPVDVVEFEGFSNKLKGESKIIDFDTVYYLVYWHDYFCSNDDGINRQMFIPPPGEEKDEDKVGVE